jgi:hypothetical protein
MPKQPTEEEKRMMEFLGFQSLPELEEFLNLPSWGCLDMQGPDVEGQRIAAALDERQSD